MLRHLLYALFLVLPVTTDPAPPPASPIKLMILNRAVAPTPMPAIDAPVPIGAGELYVVASKVECAVRSHPAGCVTVAPKTGPRDVSAKFVGGTGDDEDRTFAEPFLYYVRASHAGCVEVEVIPFGLTKASDIVVVKFDVLGGCKAGPVVPPKPVDPPATDPLFDAVQAAFGADGSPTKQADKTALAAVYAAVAAQVKDPAVRTETDLAKVIGEARAARVGSRLPAVREIVGREFGKVLPADATATLTDANRDAARAALTRFATLLEAVK